MTAVPPAVALLGLERIASCSASDLAYSYTSLRSVVCLSVCLFCYLSSFCRLPVFYCYILTLIFKLLHAVVQYFVWGAIQIKCQ